MYQKQPLLKIILVSIALLEFIILVSLITLITGYNLTMALIFSIFSLLF